MQVNTKSTSHDVLWTNINQKKKKNTYLFEITERQLFDKKDFL